MSFGKKSPTYEPVNRSMLAVIGEHFPNVKGTMIEEIFDIMTKTLHTETLHFVALVSTLSRYLAGEKDSGGFGFGPSIRLSALTRSRDGKMQSVLMELLHDVLVELPMAGQNFRRLQAYLAKTIGATIVMYHSCGDAIVDLADVDAFYAACADEQQLRTGLDWSGSTKKNVTVEQILALCDYSQRDADIAEECHNVALEAVQRFGHLSTVPADDLVAA